MDCIGIKSKGYIVLFDTNGDYIKTVSGSQQAPVKVYEQDITTRPSVDIQRINLENVKAKHNQIWPHMDNIDETLEKARQVNQLETNVCYDPSYDMRSWY